MCVSPSSDDATSSEWNLSAWTVSPLLQYGWARRARQRENRIGRSASGNGSGAINYENDNKDDDGMGDGNDAVMEANGYVIPLALHAQEMYEQPYATMLPKMVWIGHRCIAIHHNNAFTLFDMTPGSSATAAGSSLTATSGGDGDDDNATTVTATEYYEKQIDAPFIMTPLTYSPLYVRAASEWIAASLQSIPVGILAIIFGYYFH